MQAVVGSPLLPTRVRTVRFDLGGATAVPGLADSHYHLSGVGNGELTLNLEVGMATALEEGWTSVHIPGGSLADVERLAGAYAWRDIIDSGVIIAGGSDAPVERGDPRIEFYAAVSHFLV